MEQDMMTIFISICTGIISAIIYDFIKTKYIIKFFKILSNYLKNLDFTLNKRVASNFRSEMILRHFIEKETLAILETSNVKEAYNILELNKKWCLSVESKFHEYLGLVFKDELKKAIIGGRQHSLITIEMIPKNETLYFHVTDSCSKTLKAMEKAGINRAPVTLNKKVVGFISKKMLLDYLKSNNKN